METKPYLTGKNWRYLLKSSVFTFLSVFLPLLAIEVSMLDLSSISLNEITWTGIGGAIVMLFRLVLLVSARALQLLIAKLK